MSDIDWTKPVEVKIAGNWLPVKAFLKDADGQPVLDEYGSVACMPEKMHETVLFLNPYWFRNARHPKPKPRECWAVFHLEGRVSAFASMDEAAAIAPIHKFTRMREVDPTDE